KNLLSAKSPATFPAVCPPITSIATSPKSTSPSLASCVPALAAASDATSTANLPIVPTFFNFVAKPTPVAPANADTPTEAKLKSSIVLLSSSEISTVCIATSTSAPTKAPIHQGQSP